jgi:hypothetical protein
MTICVAAIGRCIDIGKDCEAIVFATDHMITLPAIGQFERSVEKYKKINVNTMAMLSGEALLFDDVLKGVVGKGDLDQIVQVTHRNMIAIRDLRVSNVIFEKLKIDFSFLKELLKAPVHNDTVKGIMAAIEKDKLDTTVLVVGFKDGLAQIIEINEFRFSNTRDINFDAIGSGAVQALNTLLFQRHSKSDDLGTTLYNVYKAKRNSEVAVGVGKETDLFILFPDGKFYEISDEQAKRLSNVYAEEMICGKQHKDLREIVRCLGEGKC